MVFSTNQNRLLYVANAFKDNSAAITALGDVQVKVDADGGRYILQKGHGGIVRSDIIPVGSVLWANVSGPADTAIKLKAKKLSLKSTVNSGNPIPGQDYIVRVNFRQLYGMSDEDIYQKFGAVHAKTDAPAAFYKEMAYSLIKNFSRVYSPLLKIGFTGAGTTFNIIKSATKAADGTITFTYDPNFNSGAAITDGNLSGIVIAEESQVNEWALGTKQYTPVYFEVIPTTVLNGALGEVEWGTVSDYTATYNQTVGNGYKFADLEYFCMGERADQYRNVGWPKSIPTKYMVDPTQTYYSLDIHYAYQGDNHAIQKSEKTMTIISATQSVIDNIVNALGFNDSYKIKETDMFDGTAGNDKTHPTSGTPIGKL